MGIGFNKEPPCLVFKTKTRVNIATAYRCELNGLAGRGRAMQLLAKLGHPGWYVFHGLCILAEIMGAIK